ncbi:glycosyltransferase involved in cell wall biosynthesis [Gelidibacter algens]|uniref:Glycosyltransferase involved in cell wall biosynthesis n=1 Tax=Gelidibacter algens TaxID=49280 RepID=A0A1A7R6B4_9FLAO|nr:glycosyltransferase [Gelidibacter algens]OBX27038.1 glycosyl transferase family 1 [Gelidibacter algens]RAJ28020.1 glycosyltransferase involved in cell wall biosynthesis [Gelidibacter algens]
MRILLVGEYSRLHNSLKEGLEALGHDVSIIASGDGFKNYPVDIKVDHSFYHPVLKKLKVGFYKLTSIDLGAYEIYLKVRLNSKKLRGFDVVQLINEFSLKTSPDLEIKIIKHLLKHNSKLYLLSCGIDYQCMRYMMDGKFSYSVMSPYIKNPSLKPQYKFQLAYLTDAFNKLHDFIYENAQGVIATDMDYHLPLVGDKAYVGMIPNPINTDEIEYVLTEIKEKIKIFHGVNTSAITKKGNDYFTEALKIIVSKFGDQVEVTTTHSLPYEKYIKSYDDCHILMDQVYAYDQGYNALEAMAKGKVVFTGAEAEWLAYYGVEEDTIAINSLPDVNYLVQKLSWLIEHPENIVEISKRARAFVESNHDYKDIAQTYVKIWNEN